MRVIVLIVLVVVAVWLVRRALRNLGQKSGASQEPAPPPGELVRCAHCGVHLPRAEARQADGTLYCSEEHARLGRARH